MKQLVRICPNHNIHVYTDQPTQKLSDIQNVEGVAHAFVVAGRGPVFIDVDPRYDTATVAEAIKQVLTVDVPSAFYEWFQAVFIARKGKELT